MSDPNNIQEIVNLTNTNKIGLEKANILFQTYIMENVFHIEKAFGCRYMAQLQVYL